MAKKVEYKTPSREIVKTVRDFLKKNKTSLLNQPDYNLYSIWSDLKPWNEEPGSWIDESELRPALEAIRDEHNLEYQKKVLATPPLEVWVMAWHTHNSVGSICHISHGEGFWLSEEACQKDIDEMKGWIGMGDRSQYRPVKLVYGPKKGD